MLRAMFSSAAGRVVLAFAILGSLATRAHADEIFDDHVHLLSPANWPKAITVETITPLLDAAKVNRAVLLSAAYRLTDEKKARVENDFVAAQVAKDPKRFLGFCAVHVKQAWAVRELERCAKQHKFAGLKLHPRAQGLDLANKKQARSMSAVLKRAGELGMVVLIDSNCRDLGACSDLINAATEHPKTRVILAHAMNLNFRQLATLAMARTENPDAGQNLYVDVAGIAPFFADSPERESIAWYLRKFGIGHVVFGSDFPVFTPKASLDALAKYGFTPAELTGIRGGNLARLFEEVRKELGK